MRLVRGYSYSCLMARFPEPLAQMVRDYGMTIPDERIYDDEDGEMGREDKPHITVKYGLHTSDPREVMSKLEGQPSVRVTLGKTSVFVNGDYVVLKIGIQGRDLFRLNKYVSDVFECTDTFPEYHPHATIAYVVNDPKEPHWFNEYGTDMFDGVEVQFDELIFSVPSGKKYRIPLTGGNSFVDERQMRSTALDVLRVAKDVLKTAGLKTDAERRKLFDELFRSRNPAIQGVITLLMSIWRIDDINWRAVRRELSKVRGGPAVVRAMEALPYFDEIVGGGYRDVEEKLGPRSPEFKELVSDWEGLERKVLRPIEEPWLEYRDSLEED